MTDRRLRDTMKNRFMTGVLVGAGSAAFVVLLAAFLILGKGNLIVNGNLAEENSGIMKKVSLLEQYIDTYYLRDTDKEQYAEGVYKGLLESLGDPYSTYYTKEEYDEVMTKSSGTYCGIGASVAQDAKSGVITIVAPFEGSPAEKAGILPGDIVYKVEGKEVTGEDLSEVVSRMKGEEGTILAMSVLRDTKIVDVTIVRKEIETPTVQAKMLENENIGYIRISGFEGVTAEQFRSALDELEKKGQKGLIIDLRGNGGGRLDAVVDMLDRMLPEGVIVSTKTKEGKGEEYKSSGKEQFNKPLAVLINGNSASASEVFAGAIQDYGIGKLVGMTSFGKGIVQTVFKLDDGSAVKLTTSEYFTPKGRNIHGKGLTPDVEVELNQELEKKVNIKESDDNQLQKAVDVVKGMME